MRVSCDILSPLIAEDSHMKINVQICRAHLLPPLTCTWKMLVHECISISNESSKNLPLRLSPGVGRGVQAPTADASWGDNMLPSMSEEDKKRLSELLPQDAQLADAPSVRRHFQYTAFLPAWGRANRPGKFSRLLPSRARTTAGF